MNKSESITHLSAALTRFQAEITPVPLDSYNPFLKIRFSSFGKVVETSRPFLAKHELSVSQPVITVNGEVGVETILMHSSGEWISTTATIPVEPEKGKSLAQVAGSNISYLRRYALASILGLYVDDDSDGNGVGTANKPAQHAQPGAKLQPREVDELLPTNGKAPFMTLEDAWKVETSKGIAYGTMTAPGLSKMISAILKSLREDELTEDDRWNMEHKLEAARIVLKAKNDGSAE